MIPPFDFSYLRYAGHSPQGFKLVFMGNVIGGIGQSFLLFVPPTLSAVWFGEKERATASSIGGYERLTFF